MHPWVCKKELGVILRIRKHRSGSTHQLGSTSLQADRERSLKCPCMAWEGSPEMKGMVLVRQLLFSDSPRKATNYKASGIWKKGKAWDPGWWLQRVLSATLDVHSSRTHLGWAKEAMGSDKVGLRNWERALMGYKREGSLKEKYSDSSEKPRESEWG